MPELVWDDTEPTNTINVTNSPYDAKPKQGEQINFNPPKIKELVWEDKNPTKFDWKKSRAAGFKELMYLAAFIGLGDAAIPSMVGMAAMPKPEQMMDENNNFKPSFQADLPNIVASNLAETGKAIGTQFVNSFNPATVKQQLQDAPVSTVMNWLLPLMLLDKPAQMLSSEIGKNTTGKVSEMAMKFGGDVPIVKQIGNQYMNIPQWKGGLAREFIQRPLTEVNRLPGTNVMGKEIPVVGMNTAKDFLAKNIIQPEMATQVYERAGIMGRTQSGKKGKIGIDQVPMPQQQIITDVGEGLKPIPNTPEIKTMQNAIRVWNVVKKGEAKKLEIPIENQERSKYLMFGKQAVENPEIKPILDKYSGGQFNDTLSTVDATGQEIVDKQALDIIKNVYKEYSDLQTQKGMWMPKEPVYYPHKFNEKVLNDQNIPIETNTIKGEKPNDVLASTMKYKNLGALKYREGATGYIKDINKVLPMEEAKISAYLATKKMVNKIMTQFGTKKHAGDLLHPDETVINPEGFLGVYKQRINNIQETIDGLKEMGNNDMAGSLEKFQSELMPSDLSNFIDTNTGLFKREGYVVKKNIAATLKAYSQPMLGQMEAPLKILFDPITAVWKFGILPLRPAWTVNDTIGNMGMFLNKRGSVSDLADATKQGVVRRIPPIVSQQTLQNQVMFTPHLGSAIDYEFLGLPVGKYAQFLREHLNDITSGQSFKIAYNKIKTATPITLPEVIKGTFGAAWSPVKGFADLNVFLDQTMQSTFRNAGYINEVKKMMRNPDFIRKVGSEQAKLMETWNTIDKLKYVNKNPEMMDAAIQETLNYFGDYSRMNPFERGVLRRFVAPFWYFTKHILQLFPRLIATHPKTAVVLQNIIEQTQEYKEDTELDQIHRDLKHRLPMYYDTPGNVMLKNNLFLDFTNANSLGLWVRLMQSGRNGMGFTDALKILGLNMPGNPILSTYQAFATGKNSMGGDINREGIMNGYTLTPDGKGIIKAPSMRVQDMFPLIQEMSPQAKLLKDTLAGGLPRYLGGGIKNSKYNFMKEKNMSLPVLRYFGIPIYENNVRAQQLELKGLPAKLKQLKRQQALDKLKKRAGE